MSKQTLYFYILGMIIIHDILCVKLEIIYWERKPYIWEENGKMEGIFPEVFYQAQRYCDPFNDELFTYKVKLESNTQFKHLLESDILNNEGILANITNPRQMLWLPFFVENKKVKKESLRARNLTMHTITSSNSVSVIVPRNQIELSYKLYKGILDTVVISAIALMLSVLSGTLMWLVERNYGTQFKDHFYNGLWWSQVTMTTTGYGDIVPVTLIGKSVAVTWMFCGLMIGSVITATVSDSVNGNTHFKLNGNRVAVVKDTYDELFTTRDFNAISIPYNTYDDVYEAVKSGAVMAGLVNTDIVSWELDKLADNTNRNNPLTLVKHIAVEFPIDALGQISNEPDGLQFLTCAFKNYRREIIERTEKYFKKHIDTETLYVGSLKETLMGDYVYLALTCTAIFILVISVLYETLKSIRDRRNRFNTRAVVSQVDKKFDKSGWNSV